MKTTQKVYEFLLAQFKPVSCNQIAKGVGIEVVTARSTMRLLCKNKRIEIKQEKFTGRRDDKKLNTFLLTSGKPASEVFDETNHSILLDILKKNTKELTYQGMADLSSGKLSLKQVRFAANEINKMKDQKLIKTKVIGESGGLVIKVRLASQGELDADKVDRHPVMNAVDLLFAGRASEALFKHNMIGGL